MSRYLDDLQKDYHEGNVVPFIGAGLSTPFKVPTWGELIEKITEKHAKDDLAWIKNAIAMDLKNYDYWGAIDMLKKYALVEEDIQEEIVGLIMKKQINLDDNSLHNYYDLSNMNFNLYLTTNYENLLQKYLDFDFQPILLKDIDFNTQNLFTQKRVCHLHGVISNSGSIVISKESYNVLYNDKKYDELLRLVTGNKHLLFMGFSFNDQFIKTLIKEHRESFKGVHYILLNNPSQETVMELRSYGLRTISYNTDGSNHANEIRKILNYISQPLKKKISNEEVDRPKSPIIIGAGMQSFKKNHENNLFFKKLKLENINPRLIGLSTAFYVAAESYIRDFKKLGMPLEIIDSLLAQVFIEYQDKYSDTYNEHGNSEELLNVVHKSLEKIDFGRLNKVLEDNTSNKHENRGFIHILADDENEQVWWGEGRFNDTKSRI